MRTEYHENKYLEFSAEEYRKHSEAISSMIMRIDIQQQIKG